ncbi:hypothetical protein [Stakelama tenebrarum]|uniref:Uncharacterized protein n=1 Tax=Stakelama tenebrarum TaxID=2711215 RepID=A0A6G6Y5T0_9SPHN|nr:hypothetical protein [Sphingosinithalassobacter tenebrarum]QIG80275.1 hypothetical protein G5C33_11140 [Sphingosinithalassobacter tenebrarum]
MSAIVAYAFFASVFGFSIWAIAASVAPKMQRIRFLLSHGPIQTEALPRHPRGSRRSREVRVSASHAAFRNAA